MHINASRHRSRLVATSLVAGLAACASATQTEQVWTSSLVATEPALQNVITLFESENETLRRAAEDRLARELARQGVRATPAYMIMPDAKIGDADRVRPRLAAMGYDGIVKMRIVDREQTFEYVPGFYGGYYGGYPYGGSRLYVPDSSYTATTYRVEASAFSLRSNQLVWSGIISTTDPDDTRELIRDTTEEAAEQLSTRGVTRDRGPG